MSAATFTGHEVIDREGAPVGTVIDVFYAERVDRPKWLVVDPGRRCRERLVPADGSSSTDDGRIRVPFDHLTIEEAPVVDHNQFPSQATRRHAAHHFGVAP